MPARRNPRKDARKRQRREVFWTSFAAVAAANVLTNPDGIIKIFGFLLRPWTG